MKGYIEGNTLLLTGMSLSLYAPKGKAGANSLTNRRLSVLPGEDRATLESDLSAPGSPSRRSRYKAY